MLDPAVRALRRCGFYENTRRRWQGKNELTHRRDAEAQSKTYKVGRRCRAATATTLRTATQVRPRSTLDRFTNRRYTPMNADFPHLRLSVAIGGCSGSQPLSPVAR